MKLSDMAGKPLHTDAVDAAYTRVRGRLLIKDTLALGILEYLNALSDIVAKGEEKDRRKTVGEAATVMLDMWASLKAPGELTTDLMWFAGTEVFPNDEPTGELMGIPYISVALVNEFNLALYYKGDCVDSIEVQPQERERDTSPANAYRLGMTRTKGDGALKHVAMDDILYGGSAVSDAMGIDVAEGDDETVVTTFAPINVQGGMQMNATLDEYQEASSGTAVYPYQDMPLGLSYVALKLAGEAGEVAEKVGKLARDEGFWSDAGRLSGGCTRNLDRDDSSPRDDDRKPWNTANRMTTANRDALKKELGDVLWYVAAAARELGFDLSDVAHANLDKLHDRAARGVLQGSGDNR